MKDLNQTIAARAYLATDQQVRALSVLNFESIEQAALTRGTFLRVEVASLQAALGMEPRRRAGGKPQSFDKDEVLATYNDMHKRLYAIVLDAVTTADIADTPKLRKAEKSRRALERNRRSNFARSAKSTLAAFIRAGGNVAALVVPQVTKAALAAETAKRKQPVQEDLATKADRICSRMVKQIENIREEDHELAQAVAQRLTVQLSEVTTDKVTKSPAKSVEENIPLRMGERFFLPMVTAANLEHIKPEPSTAH